MEIFLINFMICSASFKMKNYISKKELNYLKIREFSLKIQMKVFTKKMFYQKKILN